LQLNACHNPSLYASNSKKTTTKRKFYLVSIWSSTLRAPMVPAPAAMEEAERSLATAEEAGVGHVEQRPPSLLSLPTSTPAC
jgi:hypothetical protein